MDKAIFETQICTNREQSEKLLALGIKKETADMYLQSTFNDVWSPYIPIAMPYYRVEALGLSTNVFRVIPAWSLHSLLKFTHYKKVAVLTVDNPFGFLIGMIEKKIKNGTFNKEYLTDTETNI